jgi:hypothetical protein
VYRGDLTPIDSLWDGLKSVPDKGWYYDLQGVTGKSKERVIYPAVYVPHTLVWTGIIPQGAQDQCQAEIPDGKSRIYRVDLGTGKTKRLHEGEIGSAYYEKDALTTGFDAVKWKDKYFFGGMTSKGEAFTLPEPIAGASGGGLSRAGVINWRTVE